MRHRVSGFKLGRDTEHRRAMWRNMAIALFTHGQITTTLPKAKSVKPFVEKLITAAKKGDLASRRKVVDAIGNEVLVDFDPTELDREDLRLKESEGYRINRYGEIEDGPTVTQRLFDEIAPQYKDRAGGYTRIIKLGTHRIGDGGDLVVLQLISEDDDGPSVSGSYSRRREKANRRMEFAAELRKQRSATAKTASDETKQAGETATATATAEADDESATEEPVAEAPAEQAQADEPQSDEGGEEMKKD